MLQDFAKIRPEPVLEKRPASAPPAWSLLITGMLTGAALGVFGCVLLYLSGKVPPLQNAVASTTPVNVAPPAAAVAVDAGTGNDQAAVTPPPDLELEFYSALPDYEVVVNATPVTLAGESANESAPTDQDGLYMLQIGAFERRANADSLRARIEALQLPAVVKDEPRTGRTLYLVQAGPFTGRSAMSQAERVLSASDIPTTRISLTPTR